MTAVDDLTAWLTQILDKRERDARETIALTERAYAEVLADIAAKRRIVARCKDISDHFFGDDFTADTLRLQHVADEILKDLASAHADRPGYREEWRA